MSNTETHIVKCLRPGCGRTLRARVSIACGYGPVCRAKIRAAALAEAVKGFAERQVDKARELIADGGLVPTSRPGVFRAVGSRGDVAYLTHSAACNCPGGLRSRSACYHTLAIRIVLAAGNAA
jgi:hypothetical protein